MQRYPSSFRITRTSLWLIRPRTAPSFGYLTVVYSPKALTIAVRFSTQLMGLESRMVGDLVWNVALP